MYGMYISNLDKHSLHRRSSFHKVLTPSYPFLISFRFGFYHINIQLPFNYTVASLVFCSSLLPPTLPSSKLLLLTLFISLPLSLHGKCHTGTVKKLFESSANPASVIYHAANVARSPNIPPAFCRAKFGPASPGYK